MSGAVFFIVNNKVKQLKRKYINEEANELNYLIAISEVVVSELGIKPADNTKNS